MHSSQCESLGVPYPSREAVALALSFHEQEDDLVDAILDQYAFRGDELTFVLTLARLVAFGRDEEELAELLYELALYQAAR
jgi:hypothetical protein